MFVHISGVNIVTRRITGRKSTNPMRSMIRIDLITGPIVPQSVQRVPVVGVLHFNPAVGQRTPIRVRQGGVIVIRAQSG